MASPQDTVRTKRLKRQEELKARRGAIGDTILQFFGGSDPDTASIIDVSNQLALPVGDQPIIPGTMPPVQPALAGTAPSPAAQAPVSKAPAAQPAQSDVGSALGQVSAATPTQPFVQPQDPGFVANILSQPIQPGQGIATAPESVQTLNGIQEGTIRPTVSGEFEQPTGEISDAAAAGAPGALAKFGEFAQTISGELATNPILQDLLGQVAQALTAKDPTGFPFQLAGGIRESAQAAQVDLVRQDVLDRIAGRGPDDRVDLNQLTLSPELRKQGQLAGLSEFSAAIGGQTALAGIPSEQEREAEFELTQAQIQATQSLTNQRNIQTLEILTNAGVVDQFTSVHLSLINSINRMANQQAALVAGTTGVSIGPDGRPTFLFKDPTKANELIKEITNTQISALVDNGQLPESALILTDREAGQAVTVPDATTLDTTVQPPKSVSSDKRLPSNAKFIGSKKDDGKTLWFYDTNNDGKADTAVRS